MVVHACRPIELELIQRQGMASRRPWLRCSLFLVALLSGCWSCYTASSRGGDKGITALSQLKLQSLYRQAKDTNRS